MSLYFARGSEAEGKFNLFKYGVGEDGVSKKGGELLDR